MQGAATRPLGKEAMAVGAGAPPQRQLVVGERSLAAALAEHSMLLCRYGGDCEPRWRLRGAAWLCLMWQARRRGAGAGCGAHTVNCDWQHHSSRGLTLSIPCCFADMGETVSQAGGFMVQPGFV